MSRSTLLVLLIFAVCSLQAAPTVTIYSPTDHDRDHSYNDKNRGFAVVRDTILLDLHQGDNDVSCPAVSPFLDPASVILRDPAGKADFRVVLQKFLADVLTENAMLADFEGQILPFEIIEDGKKRRVMGKIIRAGYWQRGGGSVEEMPAPIIEAEGQYFFKLPGTPVFPKLAENKILKPELRWRINATKAIKSDVELVYLTDGLAWQADYNAIIGEDGKISQLTGWITLENDTGVRFENCQVKLIAGNVKRVRGGLNRRGPSEYERVIVTGSNIPTAEETGPAIERRTFDEYHEYTVPFPLTLSDREMTQIELVRATNVSATRSFIYNGSNVSGADVGVDYARLDSAFGTNSDSKVAIISEFKNDAQNHLGVPLPGGQVHFYRPDAEGHPVQW